MLKFLDAIDDFRCDALNPKHTRVQSKMKKLQKVCRICSSESGILLDLFSPGKTSYVTEISSCLSLEVKERDGLPQDVCIKCIGQLDECGPFYKKVIELRQEGLDKTSFGSVCYYCHSSVNYLFCTSESSLKQTKICFDFKVPAQAKICHRCQFYLETLFELREKSRSSLAQFGANAIGSKEVEGQKEDSVVDIIVSLKEKFGKKMPQSKKRKREKDLQELRVQVMDVCAYMGFSYFSNGTVNVEKFLKEMPSPGCAKRVRFVDRAEDLKASPFNHKGILKNGGSADQNNKSSTSISIKRVIGPKSKKLQTTLKLSKNMDLTSPKKFPKKSFVTLDSNSDPDSMNDSKCSEEDTSDHSILGIGPTTRKQRVQSSPDQKCKTAAPTDVNHRNSRLKTRQPEPDVPEENTNKKKRASMTKVPSKLSVGRASPRKRAVASENGTSSNSDNNDASYDLPVKRKRNLKRIDYRETQEYGELLEDDGNFEEPDETNESKSDSGLDEIKPARKKKQAYHLSPVPRGKVFEPPEYLKALDKLLVHTPKSTFKPFICPTCHEGYVSTVKGMLHKLMAHDPRSNIAVKLIRVEDDPCEIVKQNHESSGDSVITQGTANETNVVSRSSEVAEQLVESIAHVRKENELDIPNNTDEEKTTVNANDKSEKNADNCRDVCSEEETGNERAVSASDSTTGVENEDTRVQNEPERSNEQNKGKETNLLDNESEEANLSNKDETCVAEDQVPEVLECGVPNSSEDNTPKQTNHLPEELEHNISREATDTLPEQVEAETLLDMGSAEEGSVKEGSVKEGSAEEGSAGEGSAGEGSAEEGSAEEGSAEEGSAEEGSGEERSAEEGCGQARSAGEGSAEEGPAAEGPTEEGPAAEGPTEEGCTEEGSAEENSADKGSAEEGPAAEGPTEEGSAEENSADKGSADAGLLMSVSCPTKNDKDVENEEQISGVPADGEEKEEPDSRLNSVESVKDFEESVPSSSDSTAVNGKESHSDEESVKEAI